MLTVLIPTYNYTCYQLVADLQRQLEASGESYEVIVAEDGSRDQVSLIANWKINDLPHCRVIRRHENAGRAAIRNFLGKEATGEWLLFMDSDARIIRNDFIERYIEAINSNSEVGVVIGGLVHTDTMPSPEVSLRYRYEKEADKHRSAEERQQTPFMHFTTFNVCVRKSLIEAVPFDEDCKEYGYEDSLFGIELKKHGARMLHIDNPLEHLGLESNDKYLSKVETALRTLKSLGDKMVPYSHVGEAAGRLEKYCIKGLSKGLFALAKPLLRRNLLGNKPNLTVLKIYKLGYFISL